MRILLLISVVGLCLSACRCATESSESSAPTPTESSAAAILRVLDRHASNLPLTPAGEYSRKLTRGLQESLQDNPQETLEKLRQGGVIYAVARVPDRYTPGFDRVHVSLIGPRREVARIALSTKSDAAEQIVTATLPTRGREATERIWNLATAFYIRPKQQQGTEEVIDAGELPVIVLPDEVFEQEMLLRIEWSDGTSTNRVALPLAE